MNALVVALAVPAAVAWQLLLVRAGVIAARMYQIEEYESRRFLRWALRRSWVDHRAAVFAVAVAIAGYVAGLAAQTARPATTAAAWLVGSLGAHALWRWPPAKRGLVWTARMRRLASVAALLAAGLSAGVAVVVVAQLQTAASILVYAAAFFTLVAPLLLVAASVALSPVEAGIRRRYLAMARARLREVHPNVIAVVGSYGKTSTKHILARLLQPSIETLPTRKSFNTLMGVTRAINEDLAPQHRVFIVEMDAYAPGEIAAICDLTHPTLAILTSVGPQHLERFGTIERIRDALYEVAAALPPDGQLIVHTGDAGGVQLAARAAAEGRGVVRYDLRSDSNDTVADVVARDVLLDASGSRFRWSWPEQRLERDVSIPLLGRHQVLNVSAALAAVHLLGHDLEAAVRTAATLQPVEHRLQPLAGGGPLTVIDDSYNANPVGVHNGLEVLAAMPGGARILVTPGLVELGSVEIAENRRYGEHAAAVCDHVIVVSAAPAAALLEGLHSGGMAADRIHVVGGLDEGSGVLRTIARPGDVVLFANDLPDTYLPATVSNADRRIAGANAQPG